MHTPNSVTHSPCPTYHAPSSPTLEVVTPERARVMLEASGTFQNRKVNNRKVAEYTEAMRFKKWRSDLGDCIRIDTHGRVIDGQHRLLAVVASGLPQAFYVIRGLSDDAVSFIDIGLPRTSRNLLEMAGIKNASIVMSGLSWLYRYESGRLRDPRYILPTYAACDYLAEHPGIHESASVARTLSDLTRRSGVMTGLHYVFARVDQCAAENFFTKLRTGLNMSEGDPVYLLRERLIAQRFGDYELAVLAVKAWNATRTGTKVVRLIWNRGRGDEIQAVV